MFVYAGLAAQHSAIFKSYPIPGGLGRNDHSRFAILHVSLCLHVVLQKFNSILSMITGNACAMTGEQISLVCDGLERIGVLGKCDAVLSG